MRRRTALMLLAHGPLSVKEFHVITGWKSYKECHQLLRDLLLDGFLTQPKMGVYAAA
jgi:hypothetical protein